MPALGDVPKVPAHKERPRVPATEWRRRNYRTTCSKTRTNTVASILERSNRKDSALSITPIDSIRRAIARRNGVADPTVSDGAHGQGGRIENGLFPASHTAEELARIQELSQRNAGGPDSSQATRRRRERDRQPGPIHRMVNAWWNRLVEPPARSRLRRRLLHARSRVRRSRHPSRLPLEYPGHRRMGHGVSVAHHRVHTARGRRGGWQILHRLCHRHAHHDRVQLRRAQFPGLGHRRKDVLCLLPAQPLDLRSARAGMRPGIQQRPRLRCADGHNRPGRLPV